MRVYRGRSCREPAQPKCYTWEAGRTKRDKTSQLFDLLLVLGDCICAYGSRASGDVDYFKFRARGGCTRLPWYATAQRTNQAHGVMGIGVCLRDRFLSGRNALWTNISLERSTLSHQPTRRDPKRKRPNAGIVRPKVDWRSRAVREGRMSRRE